MDFLLKNLQGIENRNAHFRTIITLLEPGSAHTFEGIIRGKILMARRGTNGFGYDAVFQPDSHDRTFAEMSMEEKNKLSHRALAVRKLITFLQDRNAT